MEQQRVNHSNCTKTAFSVFAGALMADKSIKIISRKEESEKCHFIRYNVKSDAEKASIVYDTRASILTFTASKSFVATLNDLYSKATSSIVTPSQNVLSNVPKKPNNSQDAKSKPANNSNTSKPANNTNPAKPAKPANNTNTSKPAKSANNSNTSKPAKSANNSNTSKPAKPANALEAESLQYKNGYSVKNFPIEKLNLLLKRVKATGAKAKTFNVADRGKLTELKSYLIEDNKNQKVFLRYMPQKKVVQLQGKRSTLFGEIQVILNDDTDYISAVNSHIELTGEQKRAREVERQLKKALPYAYQFLSEQSKIDFSIGLMDIGNKEVKLSDYSVLLVPPYRGLERLIFDLQRAKGIEVKMIGQAFERPNGVYELKVGYKKKINSVVYCEVMTALYTEYFEKRNFYAHADASIDSVSRALSDKSAAENIFYQLLNLMDYNCKKLIEIGFTNKLTKEKKV